MDIEQFEFRKIDCSYCGTALRPTFHSRKKQVPHGSLDLNIQESVLCFQCPNCHGIKEDELITCDCGQIVDKYLRIRYLQITDYTEGNIESKIFFRCPKCMSCSICNQPVLIDNILSTCETTRKDGKHTYNTTFFHYECYYSPELVEKRARESEELKKKQAENLEKSNIKVEKLRLEWAKTERKNLLYKKIEDFLRKISIPTAILSFIGLVACTQLDNQYILFYLIASNTCRILFLASMGLIVKNEERMFGLFSLAASNLSLVLTVLAFTTDPHNNFIRLLFNIAGFFLGLFTAAALFFGAQSFFSSFFKKK